MRPPVVVVHPPLVENDPSFRQAQAQLSVEQLFAKPDALPSRWNQIGFAVSGPLTTAEDRIAAAGQTGEGHGVGGWLGDGCNA